VSDLLKEFVSIEERVEEETIVKKSRFICVLLPVAAKENAALELDAIKKKHYNANHNCSATIIGSEGEYMHASDDGEPQGTAGVPMLDVLKKNGVTNIMAVVTRYFGGTLLGAGGLVRAYSGSVAQALAKAQKIAYTPAEVYLFTIEYSDYGKLCNVAAEFGARVEGEFLDKVKAKAVLEQKYSASFRDRIKQAFMGADVYKVMENIYIHKKI